MRTLLITTNPHITIAKPSMNVVNSGVNTYFDRWQRMIPMADKVE